MSLLVADFEQRWPLFNKWLAFFHSEQPQGQDVSTWLTELEDLAAEADLPGLKTEEIMIFRILCGMTNQKIRHELTKMTKPTLKEYKDKITELEVSKRMESSLDKKPAAKAAAIKGGKVSKAQSSGAMTRAEYMKSMANRCFKCGSSDHTRRACPKADLVCHACGIAGHQSNVCYKKMTGTLPNEARGGDKGKKKAPKAKAAKVQSKHQSTYADDEEASTEAVHLVKHRLFALGAEATMT